MGDDIDLLAPIELYELDRRMRVGIENLVERVSAKAALKGRGRDLLLLVYCAGLYHGARLTERRVLSARTAW